MNISLHISKQFAFIMDSRYIICEAETKYLNRASMIYLTNNLSPCNYSVVLACGP